jgi:hypothetical protein
VGFMDKVKEQASVAASVAKEAAQKGQTKVEEIQAKRSADGVLRQLGLATYLQQAGRASSMVDADVAKYVATLKAYEDEHGELTLDGPDNT